MDGREGMTFQGSASYYLNRGGIGGSGGPAAVSSIHGAGGGSVFKPHSNSNISMQPPYVGVSGSAVSGSTFHVENQSLGFSHAMSVAPVPSMSQGGEIVKKKRGRPRKYGPDRSNVSLGLSPVSGPKRHSEDTDSAGKKRRGRPPGSGWKQQLAPLGELMNNTAGHAFSPHVIYIEAGEDVGEKILAFAQQKPRALCIMSANGSVSTLTLRQPTTSAGTLSYEGRFEILCLSGSYLLDESAGPRHRTGGLSISVCNTDGRMIGGAIGGRLIAANPVQVVACSFAYGGGIRAKTKEEPETDNEKYILPQPAEKSSVITPSSGASSHPTSGTTLWPLDSRPDFKNSRPGFDLMRG